MKNLILLLALTLTLSCCNKDEDDTQTLPPATQTGAGTFACFVNGKPFIDKTGSFNCFYQFTGGEYYFGIQGEDNSIEPFGINLGTLKKQIQQNQTYSLLEYEDYNFFGGGYFSPLPRESFRVVTINEIIQFFTSTIVSFPPPLPRESFHVITINEIMQLFTSTSVALTPPTD